MESRIRLFRDIKVQYGGFSLMELLVVIAIISLLIAITLPGLGKARSSAKRTICQSNLGQIGDAWEMYLFDNNGYFYQGKNANHTYGGHDASGLHGADRPLNPYVGLPAKLAVDPGPCVFKDPADKGNDSIDSAYTYYGNSYQANIFMIGYPQLPLPASVLERNLISQVNRRLPGLNWFEVTTSLSQVPLAGDDNWIAQRDPTQPEMKVWHGGNQRYNIAFLDGHVEWIEIKKGFYKTETFTIVPFRNLLNLINTIQKCREQDK
jgi:prepilin-type N-terminal cleavage/methylation domain-containing protein/prepilin-type processing-associated H-X9-DG protein